MADATPVCVQMLDKEPLKSFWEFATTVRRTRSLADRESTRLRGTWLAPGLAVQRVHGWGLRSVRLLCVSASSDEHCERLRLFFERDRWNQDGRLVNINDPLNHEARVLVKIPYAGAGYDSWVEHERRVLTDLASIKGVPQVAQPLFFEDINVHAATYEFCETPSVQDYLEQGRIMPPENTYSILSLMLSTLQEAHALGWLHTDLGTKDVLLPHRDCLDSLSGTSLLGAQSGGLICGWSRAVRLSQAIMPSPSIVEFALALPVMEPVGGSPHVIAEGDDVSIAEADMAATGMFDLTQKPATPVEDAENVERDFGCEASAPSIYAAPEQFLGLFAGMPSVARATDIYRAAGVTIMATCGNAPLGVQGKPVGRVAAPDIDSLRRLCKQAILKRSECDVQHGSLPTAADVQSFVASIGRLIKGQANLRGCKAAELLPWFERALERETMTRFQTVDEAMDALDAAWSEYEKRLAREARAKLKEMEDARFKEDENRVHKVEKQRQRLVFEPPPELAGMTVL